MGSSTESAENFPTDSPSLQNHQRADSAEPVLTDEQRQFAAIQHNLIYTFLREKGWSVREYYDIAAFGFLRAVRRYLTEPALQKYRFSTVAWRAMSQSITSFHRAEARRKEAEQRYMDTYAPPPDPFEALESRLILHGLAAMSSEQQYRLAAMRLQGYSIAETARAQGMSAKRVRRLLKELYRAYLELYTK